MYSRFEHEHRHTLNLEFLILVDQCAVAYVSSDHFFNLAKQMNQKVNDNHEDLEAISV